MAFARDRTTLWPPGADSRASPARRFHRIGSLALCSFTANMKAPRSALSNKIAEVLAHSGCVRLGYASEPGTADCVHEDEDSSCREELGVPHGSACRPLYNRSICGGLKAMSFDDRDFLDEAVTSELQLFGFGASAEPELELSPVPAFFAAGTAISDVDGNELASDDEVFIEERTQPIPRMTMAELVFAQPGPLPMRRGSAVGTTPPLTRPLGTLAMSSLLSSVEPEPAFDQVEMPSSVPATSRKIRPRRTRPRARTIAARRLTSIELREVANNHDEQTERPRTRAECSNEQRPCPWVSCKHHLYLDVNPHTGSIKLNFPDLEPWELKQTCALDVADDGGHTLEEVGDITNLTRERIRQLELHSLIELRGRSRSLR